MSQKISLKETEQKVFKSAFQDGLWDILIGSFVLEFAIAPFLSRSLGDFWSSAVFIPFWAIIFLVTRLVKKRVVIPRVGIVKFGSWRKARLIKFNIVTFVVGLVALALGILSSFSFDAVPGWVHIARFSLIILVGFSVAAYFTSFTHLYLYGLLIAFSPLVGEWLYVYANAPHHGFPITFGITAGVAILVGLVKFVRLLRDHPIPTKAQSA